MLAKANSVHSPMDPGKKRRSLEALMRAVEEVRTTDGPDTEETDALYGESGIHPPRELALGECLDEFELIRELGRGGMAVVYEAIRRDSGERVAVKVLHPTLKSSPRHLRRFHREAETLRQIEHPGVIRIHAVGVNGPWNYFAMDYLPGPHLGDVIERLRQARYSRDTQVEIPLVSEEADGDERAEAPALRIDPENYVWEAVQLIAEVAEGLEEAHRLGIIHRDVKPANLLFDRKGALLLTDFGIAKASFENTLTKTGEFIGSPGYISPELAASGRIPIDARTDIYSLGLTLYELVTLHQPFLNSTLASTLKAILTKEAPAPRRLNPKLPRDLEVVILKAIEKDPDRRFASAGDFAAELRRIQNLEAITVRPPSLLRRGWRMVRRRKRLAAGMAAALLVLIGGGAAIYIFGGDEQARQHRLHVESVHARYDGAVTLLRPILERLERWSPEQDDALDQLNKLHERLKELAGQPNAESGGQSSLAELAVLTDAKLRLLRAYRGWLVRSPESSERWVVRQALWHYLLDPSALVGKNAALMLAQQLGADAVDPLMDAAAKLSDGSSSALKARRIDLILSVGATRSQSAAMRLQHYLNEGSSALRAAAVEALGRIPGSDSRDMLLGLAADESQGHLQGRATRLLSERTETEADKELD